MLAVPSTVASAQSTEVVAPPAPDADALAAQVRILAMSPNDLPALLTAGELALRLGDPTAAAAFFARAEKVDPRNGRQKAGTAATLLRLERPGEALVLFGQAEALGYDPVNYASDRALAYDLIGDQPRAQRDYAVALKRDGDDPETLRRYALSLGISGDRERALEQIDKLLRQSDRAAWRVRAFILAMTGDISGADKIAATMLPGGMATSLAPFFQRLPGLSAIDRAWAVHFGEVSPTPQRLADARLAPRLAPLPPEPRPPVPAAAVPVATKPDRRKPARTVAAAPVTAPVKTTAPTTPVRATTTASPVSVATAPTIEPKPAPPPAVAAVRTQPAPAAVETSTSTRIAANPGPRSEAAPAQPPEASSPAPAFASLPAKPPVATPVTTVEARSAVVAQTPPVPEKPAPAEAVAASTVPPPETKPAAPVREVAGPPVSLADRPPAATVPVAPSPSATVPTAIASVSTERPPVVTASAKPATPPARASAPAVAAATKPPARPAPVAREASILAKIIANVSVPASELGVPPVRPGRSAKPSLDVGATSAKPQRKGDAPDMLAATEPALRRVDRRGTAADTDEKAAKPEDKKKKKAEEAAERKKKAPDPAKADPVRYWVQVAGGARESDLPKAWAAARAKAPALAGRAGYATPLRATNRVLTGPFKTEAEAQALVNTLGKQGISAFVFTSAAGQKIDKLPAK